MAAIGKLSEIPIIIGRVQGLVRVFDRLLCLFAVVKKNPRITPPPKPTPTQADAN